MTIGAAGELVVSLDESLSGLCDRESVHAERADVEVFAHGNARGSLIPRS